MNSPDGNLTRIEIKRSLSPVNTWASPEPRSPWAPPHHHPLPSAPRLGSYPRQHRHHPGHHRIPLTIISERALRIAFITPEYPGCGPSFGIGRYITDLANGLQQAGHTVTILAATDNGGWRVAPGNPPERIGSAIPHLLLRPLMTRRMLEAALNDFQPDVVECTNWGALGAWLRLPCPMVIRLSSSAGDPSFGLSGLRPWLRMQQERRAVRRSQRVIADSHGMAAAALRLYGRPVDTVQWHAYTGPIAPPRPAGPRPPRFLYVGRLEHRKGIDLLLAAWPLVRASIPTATLDIVGSDLGGFATTATTLPGVTVHGRLDDSKLTGLRDYCSIQVVPSRFESFGLVVLEAWAAGLAVVATAVGGMTEVVEEAGILTKPDDSTSLANAMVGIMSKADGLSQLGRIRLRSEFEHVRWITASINLYKSCVNTGIYPSQPPSTSRLRIPGREMRKYSS